MEAGLKLDIIQKIVNTDDDAVLKQIKDLLDSLSNDWYFSISEEERASIQRGEKDLDAGRKFSHEEIMAEAKAKFPRL